MSHETDKAPLRIGVAGLLPGTGSTTLSIDLANHFQIPRVYSGQVRRAMAAAWADYLHNHQDDTFPYTDDSLWQSFRQQFDHPQYVAAIISNHYDSPSDEDELAAFNALTERLGPEPFEVVPDIYARTMFNIGSVIVDGKLSSVLDYLSPKDTSNTSLAEVLSEQPHQLIIPYIRLILTTNFATSAKRLIQREKGKDFVGDPALHKEYRQKVQQRSRSDLKRYEQVYELEDSNGNRKPLTIESLLDVPNKYRIDTTRMSTEEAFQASLLCIRSTVLHTLATLPSDSEEYTLVVPWLDKLTSVNE